MKDGFIKIACDTPDIKVADVDYNANQIVEKIKENEKFRSDYAAMNLHDRDIIRRTRKEAMAQGSQQKAVEDAIILVKDFNVTPEIAANKMNAPLEKVLDALK